MGKSLPSDVPFASLLAYSPHGTGEVSITSRRVCYGIKGGDAVLIARAVATLRKFYDEHQLSDFLGPDVGLVPAPRSAPRVERGLWPADILARALVEAGFGREVLPHLRRTQAVPKSAFAKAGERPTYERHLQTIACDGPLLVPSRLTIIDDVVTRGRTLFACATRLRERYPAVDVRCFSVVRTMGLVPDVSEIASPCRGRLFLTGDDVDREP